MASQKWGFECWRKRRLFAWGGQGIRVNTISPGIIDTPMVHHEAKHLEGMDAMTQITPLGRWGQPAEIAEAAAFFTVPARLPS